MPLVAGAKSLELTIGQQGEPDNNVVPYQALKTNAISSSEAGVTIKGSLITPLSSTITLGKSSSYVIEFTNTGTRAGTAVVIESTNPSFSTTCKEILAAGASCRVTGTYTPLSSVPEAQTVTTTLTYTQGAPVSIPTHTVVETSGGGIVATTPTLLPSQMKVGTTKPVLFLFTNQSERSITITGRDLTGPAAGTLTPITGGDNCAGTTLSPSQACQFNANYTAPADVPTPPSITITEVVHYVDANSKAVTATATTSTDVVTTITDERQLTFVNQCNFPVWFSLNGGAIPNSPACASDPSVCPKGSSCNTGSNVCYWDNYAPSTGNYKLETTAPNNTATVDIIGTEASTLSDTLWSGNFSASLRCSGDVC
ncbi:MAG: hypothetical protein P1U32_08260, partial [Legionellaceae bacterium]|nr:hypothetical protein [Legionellaceae bacterium]